MVSNLLKDASAMNPIWIGRYVGFVFKLDIKIKNGILICIYMKVDFKKTSSGKTTYVIFYFHVVV